MKRIKILLVEDDPSLRMVIGETLEIEGFDCVIASDGLEGLKKFSEDSFDVVIADIMMPNLDGLNMIVRIRQRNKIVPILLLTAKSSVDNVIEGFNAGADDYIRKPFNMKELIVRVRSLYSRVYGDERKEAKISSNLISIGSYTFDPISQMIYFEGNSKFLSTRENEILRMLAEHVNVTISSDEIMNQIWGDNSIYVVKSLQVFITRLRSILKNDPSVRIINARGVGYKLVIDLPDKTENTWYQSV